MPARIVPAIVASLFIAGCGQSDRDTHPLEPVPTTPDSAQQAQEIALNSIIVDTHIDVPYRLNEEWADVSLATEGGDFDYPRAVAGGLNVAFMSIYTPASLEAEGGSKALAESLIDMVQKIAADAPEKFAIALSPDDVDRHFREGLISLPLGMENGSPLEEDLANVAYFFERGIRYITLAHSLSNQLSDSSYDDDKRWGGLSDFGVEVVGEMNRLGIIVDVSHLSDDAFRHVLEVSSAPVIASHSSARHFTPGWERNMSDEMIQELAANGGLIMISFGSAFISGDSQRYGEERGEAFTAWLEENDVESSDEVRQQFYDQYAEEHGPYPFATLEQTLDHFDHVVRLTGVASVGIGSDYDGVGDTLPVGLKDVSTYPNLVQGFLERGYSVADIEKILGGNLLRVWREVENVARGLSEPETAAAAN
ncbi:MAG TPA: dipeptidase [Woeseiaceae bacterium]